MGITFRPAPTPESTVVLDYRIECSAEEGPGDTRRFPTYPQARVALAEHHRWCHDPSCWAGTAHMVARTAGDDEPVVEVSSSNGALLLRALGLAVELGADDISDEAREGDTLLVAPIEAQFPWSGEIDAQELIERVLLARALQPADSGLPVHTLSGDDRFIDCGRRPGYLDQRLDNLDDLAHYARAGHRQVVWH